MSKRVIVLGANGMAGHVITLGLRNVPKSYEVISVARSNSAIKPSVILDVSDFNGLRDLIAVTNPDFIINCIGLLNKTAEDNPDQAILINSYLPHFLESITRNTKTRVIHISTDCVFSGDEGSYLESSPKNGRGFYAQSKALGELNNEKDLTFRTSIVGPELQNSGIGLFNWYANQNGTISGYSKAFWTGITTIELLNAVKSAMESEISGLYHLVNDEKISKYQLLNYFNSVFETGLNIIKVDSYQVDKSLVNTRTDFSFEVNHYSKMVSEMKNWILENKDLYPHYKKLMN